MICVKKNFQEYFCIYNMTVLCSRYTGLKFFNVLCTIITIITLTIDKNKFNIFRQIKKYNSNSLLCFKRNYQMCRLSQQQKSFYWYHSSHFQILHHIVWMKMMSWMQTGEKEIILFKL